MKKHLFCFCFCFLPQQKKDVFQAQPSLPASSCHPTATVCHPPSAAPPDWLPKRYATCSKTSQSTSWQNRSRSPVLSHAATLSIGTSSSNSRSGGEIALTGRLRRDRSPMCHCTCENRKSCWLLVSPSKSFFLWLLRFINLRFLVAAGFYLSLSITSATCDPETCWETTLKNIICC